MELAESSARVLGRRIPSAASVLQIILRESLFAFRSSLFGWVKVLSYILLNFTFFALLNSRRRVFCVPPDYYSFSSTLGEAFLCMSTATICRAKIFIKEFAPPVIPVDASSFIMRLGIQHH